MDRFVGLVWDPADIKAGLRALAWALDLQTRSRNWSRVVDTAGMLVLILKQWGEDVVAARLTNVEGVVVGKLFQRGQEQSGRLTQLSAEAADRTLDKSGDGFLRDYWGAYVALWRDPVGNITVLRDPGGGVPCFTTRAHGVDLIFSHTPDIAPLPGLQFSPDAAFLRAFLIDAYPRTRRTGLEGVTDLLPGERLVWRPGSPPKRRRAWDARTFAAAPIQRDRDSASAELRHIAQTCFAAWGSTYRNIVVRTSGGLDSSIVLNLLNQTSSATITAVHLTGRDYEAREARFAALAAAHAGLDLVEVALDDRLMDLTGILEELPLARPTREIFGRQADIQLGWACADIGADAIAGGHGGDAIFLQTSLATDVLSDHVSLTGVGRQTLDVAYQTSALLERSIWGVLKRAAVNTLHPRNRRRPDAAAAIMRSPYRLVTDDLLQSITPDDPDVFNSGHTATLPPAKAAQTAAIQALGAHAPSRGVGVVRDALYPFMSQPIIEFALSTPSYTLAGGVDRRLERQSFADLLSPEISRRANKGFINHHLLRLLATNIDFLRDLVFQGTCIRNGWIDAKRADHAFSLEGLLSGRGLDAVLGLIAIEAWFECWKRRGLF